MKVKISIAIKEQEILRSANQSWASDKHHKRAEEDIKFAEKSNLSCH